MAILRRWLWILLYALIGAAVFEVVLPIAFVFWKTHPMPSWYAGWFTDWFVLLASAWFVVLPLNLRCTWNHPRLQLKHPPLWAAVVLALFIASASEHLPLHWRPQHLPGAALNWPAVLKLSLSLALALVVAARAGFEWRKSVADKSRTEKPEPSSVSRKANEEWAELDRWLQSEEPVQEKKDDRFGHAVIAERIIEGLLESGSKQSVALLGPKGSGKSSILRWVMARIGASGRVVIAVEFNCWAIPHPEDAPRIALEQILDALSGSIDVQQFRNLPKAYQRLIAAEPSGFIRRLLGDVSAGDPLELLNPLNDVLRAVGIEVLLIIEDAERAGSVASEVRHLERLLWTLRETSQINFVLAVDDTVANFDFAKLCDAIEKIPLMDPEGCFDILEAAYDKWVRKGKVILPDAKVRARTGLRLRGQDPIYGKPMRERDRNHPAYAIAALIESPRELKQMLRAVDRSWERLHGEVCLDDLIVLETLRHGEAQAFNYLVSHADAAREAPSPAVSDAVAHAGNHWKAWVAGHAAGTAIQQLVEVLQIRQFCQTDVEPGLQSVGQIEPDYLRRILAGRIEAAQMRDQEVLAEIDGWKRRETQSMAESLRAQSLRGERFRERWLHFSVLIDTGERYRLAETLINEVIPWGTWDQSSEAPIVTALRALADGPFDIDERTAWLRARITEAMPFSIGLANWLFQFWGSTVHYSLVNSSGRASIRLAMLDTARAAFSNVDMLLDAIKRSRWECISLLVSPVWWGEPPDPVPPRAWQFLAPVLLGAAHRMPERIIPDVALMVADPRRRSEREPALSESDWIDRSRMKELMGKETEPMLRLLAACTGGDGYTRAAARSASKWLEEGGPDTFTTAGATG